MMALYNANDMIEVGYDNRYCMVMYTYGFEPSCFHL